MKVNFNIAEVQEYFFSRMKNISIYRVGYEVVETFRQYLFHWYRNNCYNYSSYVIIGMRSDDYLVRGEITLSNDWMWENGGYEHGWVEFTYKGEEFVFDSLCKEIWTKEEWYKEYNPQNLIKFTKREILSELFASERVQKVSDDCFKVNDEFFLSDTNHIKNPFRNAKIYGSETHIECFVACAPLCN